MFSACCWVILGSYLYIGATAGHPQLLYAGRFFTGIGVGTYSGVGPLYNAEISAPETRGFIVSFYQFATILGIMLSFWIGYGSNYIGGPDEGQSNLAWRLPSIIQGIPSILLAVGIWWMPFSPRWLVKVGKYEKARETLAWLRKRPVDDQLIEAELLEIKAEALFERRVFEKNFPKLAAKVCAASISTLRDQIRLHIRVAISTRRSQELTLRHRKSIMSSSGSWQAISPYSSRETTSREYPPRGWSCSGSSGLVSTQVRPAETIRVCSRQLTRLVVIYYASSVFQSYGFSEGTTAELATGVTGSVFLISTIPAMVRFLLQCSSSSAELTK